MAGSYVYALHDFSAEHEDEIAFRAGERIEVVERDDQFGDGWWQGRNLAGKVGLFPQNYTTPEPPHPAPTAPLPPLTNVPEGDEHESSQMAATMTDVQKALDQLGMGNRTMSQDLDRRSLSFVSGSETDHESEAEGDNAHTGQNGNHTWGADSRKLLAEKARRELEDRQKREQLAAAAAPPIEVDMSDESEDEPEHEEEGSIGFKSARTSVQPVTPTPSTSFPTPTVASFSPTTLEPPKFEPVRPPSQASSKTSLLLQQVSRTHSHLTVTNPDAPSEGEPSPISPPTATALAATPPVPPIISLLPAAEAITRKTEVETDMPQVAMGAALPKSAAPSEKPTVSGAPTPPARSRPPTPPASQAPPSPRHLPAPVTFFPDAQVVSSPVGHPAPGQLAPALPISSPTQPAPAPTSPTNSSALPADPNTWTTSDVLAWLTSRNFDSAILDRFAEQDISGDVLLSLDMGLLKDELGITAFGKRVRLNNAISELRRGSPGQGQDGSPGGSGGIPSGFVWSPESAPRTGEISQSQAQSPANWTPRREEPEETHGLVGLGFVNAPLKGHRPSQISVSSSDGAASEKGRRSTIGAAEPDFIREEEENVVKPTSNGETIASAGPTHMRAAESYSTNGTSLIHPAEPEPDAIPSSSVSASASLKQSQTQSTTLDTPLSSIPPSPIISAPGKRGSVDSPPASATIKRPGSSGGLKAKRASEGKDSRLSFFGGTLGKTRKPPPRYSSENGSDTSPTFSTQPEKRSLSRLYLGGSTHKKSSSGGGGSMRLSSGASGALPNASPTAGSTTVSPSQHSGDSPNVLRKRLSSPNTHEFGARDRPIVEAIGEGAPGENPLDQIGEPDHEGWMRKKGERYNSWKLRYFVLKGQHLYYMRSKNETKIKGYINVAGYKVIADENTNVGKYGFRIVHETERPHFFSSEEQMVIREWMKAIMKATIGRDFSRPVISSCNIPTIPLNVAQAMSPAPRPPSPTAREATQRALRPANPDKLSDRDAAVLMLGVKGQEKPGDDQMRARVESMFTYASADSNDYREARAAEPASPLPPRPARDIRKPSQPVAKELEPHERELLVWVNENLPKSTGRASDLSHSCSSGLVLFRLIERLSGKLTGVPDSLFQTPPDSEESFEGLFRLFDAMVENGISTANVSMSDVHAGDKTSVVQLIESIRAWSERR